MKKLILTCSLVLFSIQILFAWGQNGHRIVAQICYDNLNDESKKEIDQILGNDYLAQVATWPDFIRSESNWDFTKPWHFITIDPGKTVQQVIDESKKKTSIDNVVEAIELMKAILKNDKSATSTFQDLMDANKVTPLNGSIKATALAFLVHFIGDIHQPMHVGKNNDFGGNKISVLFFDEKSNLHSVWDSGIIDQEQLSFTDFANFVDKHQSPNREKWQKTNIAEWATESVNHRENIYNTLYDQTDKYETGLPSMSYQYQHDFLPVVEERLAAAGYRAARIINTLF
jgi:hypothetical protein